MNWGFEALSLLQVHKIHIFDGYISLNKLLDILLDVSSLTEKRSNCQTLHKGHQSRNERRRTGLCFAYQNWTGLLGIGTLHLLLIGNKMLYIPVQGCKKKKFNPMLWMIATFPSYEILILFILEHYKHAHDAYFSFIVTFTSLNVLRICELRYLLRLFTQWLLEWFQLNFPSISETQVGTNLYFDICAIFARSKQWKQSFQSRLNNLCSPRNFILVIIY